jgi:hypothetical protein
MIPVPFEGLVTKGKFWHMGLRKVYFFGFKFAPSNVSAINKEVQNSLLNKSLVTWHQW